MSYVSIKFDLEQNLDYLRELQVDVIKERDLSTGEDKTTLRRVSVHLDNATQSLQWALDEIAGTKHEPLVRADR